MPKPRLPAAAKLGKAGARIKTAKPKKWVPTTVGSELPWKKALWPEKRRRYQGFLMAVLKAGRSGRVEISEYEDAFLQSFADKLRLPSTAGRIGKPGLITRDELEVIRELHKKLEVIGVWMPDIGFG